jgi:hypothetical protein
MASLLDKAKRAQAVRVHCQRHYQEQYTEQRVAILSVSAEEIKLNRDTETLEVIRESLSFANKQLDLARQRLREAEVDTQRLPVCLI